MVSVRLNPYKSEGVRLPILEGARKVPWSPYGYILSERPVFTLHPLFHAGVYYVQDSSAMYVGHVARKALARCGGRGTLHVLDLCAAPGGKTTDLAASLRALCGDRFELVSNEVMKMRSRVLCDNVALWGDPNVVVTSVDPAVIGERLPGYFDLIVTDVPCSGEGMFEKDERAVQEWTPELVGLCAARQKRIVADVWPALREGGVLVYSTCTYEDAENDSNVEWICSELGGALIQSEDEFPDWGVRLTRCGHLLKAGEVPGDGQWVGSLVKTAGVPDSGCAGRIPGVVWQKPDRGTVKGSKFIPNPDWVLSLDYDHSLPEVEVGKRTALLFLHRDSIVLSPDAPRGMAVLTYRGVPLGCVNNLGARCNNLHPQARRILMDIPLEV